ncbi:MAG: flagellar hook-length control protein FliK [Denitratisoma sp.]|nr:flagellar hook-length control protein FliK [Denitratisoma sp.]
MTQVSAAPQPLPGIAPAQAGAATGAAEAAAGTEGTADFAAVLRAQFGQPAKDAPEAEILAALLPVQAADAAEEAVPADALPIAPDLAALLPVLASLMPQTTAAPAIAPEQPAAGPAGNQATLSASLDSAPLVASPALSAEASADASDAGEAAAALLQPGRQAGEPSAPPLQADMAQAAAAAPQMPAAAAEHANPTAMAHAAAPSAHAAAADNTPAAVRVDTPVGSRGWDAEVGQKVVLLVNRLESRAELTLTPPQMGRVEVSISVSGDQTSAAFVSASPAAREALEQALPRLREILAEAGITLGQASVNAESPRQDREGTPAEHRGGNRNVESAGTAAPAQWLRRSEGLVDTFA